MLCIGHRGARGHAPENTLLSFRRALELGAHSIELDVYLCEGELVVIHDDTLDRTTNGHGPIGSHTLAELRRLDAGQGERIPLLREVFDMVDRRAGINIELKGPGTAAAVAAFVAYYRQAGWDDALLLVSSFDWEELAAFRAHDACTRIGLLFDAWPDTLEAATRELRSHAWHPQRRQVNAHLVQRAHALQQRVYTYTVNDGAELQRLHALGVDGVFTDYPERAVPWQGDDEGGFY